MLTINNLLIIIIIFNVKLNIELALHLTFHFVEFLNNSHYLLITIMIYHLDSYNNILNSYAIHSKDSRIEFKCSYIILINKYIFQLLLIYCSFWESSLIINISSLIYLQTYTRENDASRFRFFICISVYRHTVYLVYIFILLYSNLTWFQLN